MCSNRKQAKDETTEESAESAQLGHKDPTMLERLSNLVGPRKDEPDVDKEDNLGVVMFFGGIWWRNVGLLPRKLKIEEEQRKQKFLGEDPNEDLSVSVEDLQVTTSDSQEAVLKFTPGIVGEALPSDHLPRDYNSFEMYGS